MRETLLAPIVWTTGPNRRSRNVLLFVCVAALVAALVPFTAAQSAERFTFNGAGWGHGVGMSQYGARNRAEAGATAADILAAYYPGAEIASYPPPETIRVHLGDVSTTGASTPGSIEIRQDDVVIATYGPGVDTTFGVSDGAVTVADTVITASKEHPVEVSFDEPLYLGAFGHHYLFGKLAMWPVNGELRIVEFGMSMDSYVKGIAEMPSSWPQEALKAQAIAARTYAHYVTNARRVDPGWTSGYDVSASTLDQNYEGYDAAVSAWTDAVEATSNIEMLYDGMPIKAYYSSSNGGSTETSGVVFDMPLPYTVATDDPYDADDNSWSRWSRTYNAEELSSWLNRVSESAVGTVESIQIDASTAGSRRLDSTPVTITGSDRTVTLTGRRFMVIVNSGIFDAGGSLSDHLPSTRMVLDAEFDSSANSASSDGEGAGSDGGTDADAAEAKDVVAPIVLRAADVPEVTDVEGPQRVEASIDRFNVIEQGLEIEGYAVDPDASTVDVSVRVAIDGVIVDEVATSQSRYTLAVDLPADGEIKDVCVYAHEVDVAESVSVGCRAVRAASSDGTTVGTSGTNSGG